MSVMRRSEGFEARLTFWVTNSTCSSTDAKAIAPRLSPPSAHPLRKERRDCAGATEEGPAWVCSVCGVDMAIAVVGGRGCARGGREDGQPRAGLRERRVGSGSPRPLRQDLPDARLGHRERLDVG